MHEIQDFSKLDAAIEKFQALSVDIEWKQKSLKNLETTMISDKVPEDINYFLRCSRTAMVM
jgi:hypothetical protein